MESTTKKVTTKMLVDLYREMYDLFPNTNIEEFEEIIIEDGYWDTRARLSINRETNHWLDNIGGRDKLKELYSEFRNGTLDDRINNQKQKLKKYLK